MPCCSSRASVPRALTSDKGGPSPADRGPSAHPAGTTPRARHRRHDKEAPFGPRERASIGPREQATPVRFHRQGVAAPALHCYRREQWLPRSWHAARVESHHAAPIPVPLTPYLPEGPTQRDSKVVHGSPSRVSSTRSAWPRRSTGTGRRWTERRPGLSFL